MAAAIIPFPPPPPSAPSRPDADLKTSVDQLLKLQHQLLQQRDLLIKNACVGGAAPQVGTALCEAIDALARCIDVVVFVVSGDRP
jgi:hypothetical protein